MTEKNNISDGEIERIIKIADVSTKVESLGKDVSQIFAAIRELNINITNIPSEIVKCKSNLDSEIKKYIHSNFVSEKDLEVFSLKLEKQMETEIEEEIKPVLAKLGIMEVKLNNMDKKTWIATGIVSGVIAVGMVVQFLLLHTNIIIQ